MLGDWFRLRGKAWPAIVVVVGTTVPTFADTTVNIPQGWTNEQKRDWHTLSQGSRLIPERWLRALEQPGSSKPFLDADHIEKFRYLPGEDGLPVGFALDEQDDSYFSNTRLRWRRNQPDDEKWVGFNCAACHTGEITYQGKRMRIEGAPTLADFQSFIEALNRALDETSSDPDKNRRFASNVLTVKKGNAIITDENNADNRKQLNEALAQLIAWQAKVAKANATPLRYGFGRLDAFGHIYNKVAIAVQRDGVPQTFHPSNAPVSYPFLWNVHQHDKVQWNGAAKNTRNSYDIGALGRNIGQVTGVFADVSWFVQDNESPSITSSADVENLGALEGQIKNLAPPAWPTGVLGKIDRAKRDKGQKIFVDRNRRNEDGSRIKSCADCHVRLPRIDLTSPIEAKMTPLREIGTDIWMACNALTHQASTGVLLNSSAPVGRYGAQARIVDMLVTTVTNTILANLDSVAGGILGGYSAATPGGLGIAADAPSALPAAERPVRSLAKQSLRNRCLNGTDELLAYKARPLTGIWATAPYLHNGSVPTLYDLLLPPDQRPKQFATGTREFDPVRVGFVTRDSNGNIAAPSGDNSFLFQTRDASGRVIDGNSNAGHDYGNALFTDEERWALVEYMKGL